MQVHMFSTKSGYCLHEGTVLSCGQQLYAYSWQILAIKAPVPNAGHSVWADVDCDRP